MRPPLVIAALLLAACGGATPSSEPARGDLSGALASWGDPPTADAPAAHRLQRTAGPSSPSNPQRTRPSPHRHRARPVDVHLHRAPLASALRLLADAADLSIVIGEGLDREITVDLWRVDPLEAIRAIAEAHDVELSMQGQTVVARAR